MPYELPPLPYAYNALEPYYDEQTVRLHHDKHHAGYVAGLNKAEAELAAARASGEYGLVKHWERELAFHGSGHVLHTLFWENMAPGGDPRGDDIAPQLAADFGSPAAFKAQFIAAAVAVEGSGWCTLAWVSALGKLAVLQVEKHQDLTVWGAVPLLIVDVWEHAYYLKYQNRRADWVGQWWNIINWHDVATRFAKLSK